MSRKILLADDSVTAQNMGRRILTEAGYEVVTVNNGPAALKKLAEQKPDLVILDIYMPGYGGIEVCQRIKETAETASIPVLLTVGKLEPFKADEARRVRADAHLVKPFEATELLAALTKLEDKIVPQGGPRPAGKAGKGKATEQAASSGKDKKFGDTDSGWKQRLTIPPPEAKRPEPEAEAPRTAFREFSHSETAEPVAQGSESTSHQDLGQDITAEEIAAITAAAVAFGNAESPDSEHSPITVTEEEIAAAVNCMPARFEPAPESITENAPEPSSLEEATATDAAALVEQEATEQLNDERETVVEPEVRAVESQAQPEAMPIEAAVRDAAAPAATDDEVAAVLASLAPVNGSIAAGIGAAEAAFAAAGSSWRSFASVGTRWMAEKVTVPESEASLILEEEMQKAYAALAEFGPEAAVPHIYESRIEENAASSVEDMGAAAVSRQEFEPIAASAGAGNDSPPPVEVSVTAQQEELREEIPHEEPGSDSTAAIAKSSETMQAVEPVTIAGGTVEANASLEESAYAAAASAGTEFHAISHVEAAPTEIQEPVEGHSSAPAEVDHEHEAELAAAWAHWRQIRETIANPKLTSQLADAAAAGYKEIHQPESSATSSPDTSANDEGAAADPSAIASIVDSVLAELKPKLVAEIARKLGKEKEKKEKK